MMIMVMHVTSLIEGFPNSEMPHSDSGRGVALF